MRLRSLGSQQHAVHTVLRSGGMNIQLTSRARRSSSSLTMMILADTMREQMAKSLRGVATSVKVLALPGLPEGGDAYDWIETGGTAEKLWALVEAVDANGPDLGGDVLSLDTFCAADFEGVQVPPREWLVEDIIPHENVALFTGDGGIGKTILALQLGVSLSTRTDWLGFKCMQGPSLYVGAEDSKNEIHRRLDQMRVELGISWGDLADFHGKSLAGDDALLGLFSTANQTVNPTKLCKQLERRLQDIGAIACFIDTAADAFGGDEINRQQVRQFVGLFRGICLRNHLNIILLAHPSVSGMQSGSGLSGSTQWHNGPRSRLYLTYGDKDNDGEPHDLDERFLKFKKSNYAAKAKPMRLRWRNGLFVPDTGEKAAAATAANAEAMFLATLDRYTKEGRYVCATTGPGYAPKVFADDPNGKAGKEALKDAMNNLFAKKQIAIEKIGPPSRQIARIVRQQSTEGENQ